VTNKSLYALKLTSLFVWVYRCGKKIYQFLWLCWDRLIKPAFRWCVHTSTNSGFRWWSSWPRLLPI